MDPFTLMEYHYSGSPNVMGPHVPQQPQEYPHHAPLMNVPSMENQVLSENDCTRSTLNNTVQPHSLHDFTPSHGLGPRQESSPNPNEVAYSDFTGSMKMYCKGESTNVSDQYIPSSSDKITCTDHRPLDEIFGSIHPSSRWSQAKSGLIRSPRSGTLQGHLRRTSGPTCPIPAKPQLDGIIHIPLLAVNNQMSGTGLVVDFRCSDWGIGVHVDGIPMSELLHGNVSGLENPYQRVLDGLGMTHLRFHILWPHYPPFMKVLSAFGTDRKPITRAELGYEVSLAFAEFFYHITSHSIPPARSGPYAISSSGSSSHGITYAQLHLIAVRNTGCGEWMAEIRAISTS